MNFIKPTKLLLFSGLIWLYSYMTLPANYLDLGDSLFFPIFTLVAYVFFFVFGLKSIKQVSFKPTILSEKRKVILLVILFLLGFVGVVIKIYQRVYLEKIYFAENLVKTRMDLLLGEFNSGALGLFSALTFPFATVALMMVLLWVKKINKALQFLIIPFGLFPIVDAVLTQSRLIIVLTLGMLVFTLVASRKALFSKVKHIKFVGLKLVSIPKFFFRKIVWVPSLILLLVLAVFSKSVINNRLSVFNYRDVVWVWEFQQQVKVDDEFKLAIKNAENNSEKNSLIGGYSLRHYFAHGVFEYIRLNNHLEKSTGYYYGMFELYTYVKVFKLLGINIPSFGELNKISYKKAVYTTFWGPFYIDFGIFGFIVCYFLGRQVKRIYLKAEQGCENSILLYAFFGVVILASFFVNLLNGANLYFLNAIFIAIILKGLLKLKFTISR